MTLIATALAPALLALCLSGCAGPVGLIYTDVTLPLDLDQHATPAPSGEGQRDWKTFAYIIRVDWDSAAIADAAHAGGLKELYFADQHVLSVLGIWHQRTALVYGK